jgi:methylamine utilization protein MauE
LHEGDRIVIAISGAAVALAIAVVLLWAALEKARNLAPTAAAIRHLGFSRRIAWPAAGFVTAAEVLIAVAVLFRPDSALTQAGIIVLAGLFALAGLLALRLDHPIPCHCFGAGGKNLGLTQVIAFLPWLASAGLLRFGIRQALPVATAAACFAAISLTLAGIRGFHVWRAQREARSDRRSAQEMYAWLPSH